MSRANFTDQGLPIGQNDVNMTYLYGLSDFFSVMFEDTSTVNLLLEATTQGAAEAYSQFLQLTSTLSLQTITETMGVSVKLILINSTDAVVGEVNKFRLNETVLSSRYLANRPFLPTSTLEELVDFRIDTDDNGVSTITFAQNIESYKFSTRTLQDGTRQYAIWFVDAEIDERMISTYYGDLIGVSPQNSTDAFYNFVYGLYYVYIQGPTLEVMRKGLNLTLGIPLARSNETVLDIRRYLDTNQYIVVTDENQYLIPYGLPPSVDIGDTLRVGDDLAQWVEIKDYLNDGEWWINLHIPPTIIPSLPAGQKDRYATKGSHFDYLMRNYLKKHTFLVKINVGSFENIQRFEQLADIIRRAKPTYTQPIYIWTIDTLSETIYLNDDRQFVTRVEPHRCENIGLPIARFYRNNDENPVMRSCPQFIRYNVPFSVTKLCGTDEYINGDPDSMTLNGSVVTGFTDPIAQFRPNTDQEKAWMRAVMFRSSPVWRGSRTQVGFRKKPLIPSNYDGAPVNVNSRAWETPVGYRVVPLYATTIYDIKAKCDDIGVEPPSDQLWSFPLFGAGNGSQAINMIGINEPSFRVDTQILLDNFNIAFFRGDDVGYLGAAMPEQGWRTFAPTPPDLRAGDYLLGIRITDTTVGVYWVTSNFDVEVPIYFPVSEPDPLNVTYEMPLYRAGGLNGAPFYVLRGKGTLNYNNVKTAINEAVINSHESVASPTVDQEYRDKYNPTNVIITRSGAQIVHAIESK